MGTPLDLRTDIYSLGVTYYEALTGRMPFEADSPMALLRQILQEEPPDITSLNREVDADTRRIVHRMIAKDREQRYPTCHELAAELEAYLSARGALRGLAAGLAGAGTAARADVFGAGAVGGEAPTTYMPESGAPPPRMRPAPGTATPPPPPVAMPVGSALAVRPPAVVAGTIPAAVAGVVPPARRSSVLPVLLVLALLLLGGVAAGAWLLWPTVSRVLGLGGQPKASEPARVVGNAPAAAAATRDDANAGAPAERGGQTPAEAGGAAAAAAAAGSSRPAGAPSRAAATGDRPSQASSGEVAVAGPSAGVTAAPAQAESRIADQPTASGAGVAVAVVGDPGLVGAVSSYLMGELGAAGLEPLDAATLPELEGVVRSQADVATADLLRGAYQAGVTAVVLVRVDPAGQRELRYMNRYDTAYSARVTITCLDVASGRARGRPASATVEYTALTAERATEQALGGLVAGVVDQAR